MYIMCFFTFQLIWSIILTDRGGQDTKPLTAPPEIPVDLVAQAELVSAELVKKGAKELEEKNLLEVPWKPAGSCLNSFSNY